MTRDGLSSDHIAGTFAACGELRQVVWDWLRKAGVPASAIGRRIIRRASVTFASDGIFDFTDDGGESALVFLVCDPWATPTDIAIWQPRSNRMASWLGRCWALGEGSIYAPRLIFEGALPIWQNALEWLRANRQGLVILRPDAATHYFADTGPLLAEDVDHGVELQAALARPAPRIVVPSNGRRAA
jgi:hypothetical protein